MQPLLSSVGDDGTAFHAVLGSTTAATKPKAVSKSGLLMDWLHLLDPELSQANPEVKQKLLFAKSEFCYIN